MYPNYKLSENGYNFLLQQEEIKTKPYLDSDGMYRVGLNHKGLEINPLHEYTMEEIRMLFEQDRGAIEEDVNKIFDPKFMTQNMFDACFSFAYSIGGIISTTELGKLIQMNPYSDQIRDIWSQTYIQKSPKLAQRRQREIKLYFDI